MYLYYYSYPDARALVENSSALYICTLTVSKHNNFKLFVYTINLSLSLDIYIYIYIYYNFIIHIRKRDLVAGLEAQHVLDGVEDHLRPIHELRVCRWNGNG